MYGLGAALALSLAVAVPVAAQEPAGTPPAAPTILLLDQERMFEQSQWGLRALAQIGEDSNTLAAENRRIEADLSAEEKDLAAKRATLPADEFRSLADAFDRKVIEIRRNQDTKLRDLNRLNDAERQAFFAEAAPILRDFLLASQGAVAILDRRAVLVATESIDVTDKAIALMDAQLGAGERPILPPEQN